MTDIPISIIAIDPGTEQSAYVIYDGEKPITFGTESNHLIRRRLLQWEHQLPLVVENVESYGKPVGRETFETVKWIGRFQEIWFPRPVVFVSRRHAKMWLCNSSSKVTDANVSAALYDKWGGSRSAAIGTKKQPGPLYGMKGHEFAALAVAVTFTESDQYADIRRKLEINNGVLHDLANTDRVL